MGKNLKNGVELKYPLTPKAEMQIKAMKPLINESLANEIRCFLASLRPELQDDEALSLAYITEAFRLIPKELGFVETTMLGFYIRIKEQVLDKVAGRGG